MGQITIYLDSETQSALRAAAKAANKSQSRWVADLIRERTMARWPARIVEAAGTWTDMSVPEDLEHTEDLQRESL